MRDQYTTQRRTIAEQIARLDPESIAAGYLRGNRVLGEVDAVRPGELGAVRRKANGWLCPLSLAKGTAGREIRDRIAHEFGIDPETMERDLRLAEAVEVIAKNCGVGALRLMLNPGGRLNRPLILRISRKGPERQRYAMSEATQGRDLLARPAKGIWPQDTRDFEKVPGRLGRARGAVESCIADVPALLVRQRPTPEELAVIRGHLAGIIGWSGQFLQVVEERATGDPPEVGKGHEPCIRTTDSPGRKKSGTQLKSFAQIKGCLDAAQYFVEKTAMDVPRLPAGMRPTPEQIADFHAQVRALIDGSSRLLALFEPPRAIEASAPGQS